MITVNQILDAGEAAVKALWPDDHVYRNLTPKGFTRPSSLIQVNDMAMEPFTCGMVDRSAALKVTLFVPVDDYHHSHVEDLADRLTLALEQFSVVALPVGDRHLDVGKVSGNYEYDFAELTVPLSWVDDRDTGAVEHELMQHYTLATEAGGKEE